MYKDGSLLDRREMLRVKLKSLAEESRIIRKEERRTDGMLREELHKHRVREVRKAARHTHLAYGLIRGKTPEQIEPNAVIPPDWKAVNAMIRKYGPVNAALVPESA